MDQQNQAADTEHEVYGGDIPDEEIYEDDEIYQQQHDDNNNDKTNSDELEDMKKRIKEIEEEAGAVREMQSKAEKDTAVGEILPTLDEIGSSILQVLGNIPNAVSFAEFARKYGKKYESTEEIKHRFKILCDNLDLVRSTNNKNLSYTLDINEYADRSLEEFKQCNYSPNVTSMCTSTDKVHPDEALP